MSIEFPLPQRQTTFGLISDPRIPIPVRTLTGYRPFDFLIDTGADISLAPRRVATLVGLDWTALPDAHVRGVGSDTVQARVGTLSMRMEELELTIRRLFVDSPRTLFILGRADFLDRFVLTIDPRRRRITLDPVSEAP